MDLPLIYLNNAATSWPKPPGVIAAVRESLALPFSEAGRSATGLSADCVADAREAVARYFHAPKTDHVIFSANATDALNTLISGFAKKEAEPFHVVISDLEHNSVIRPLRTLEAEGRCSITVVSSTEARIDPDGVAAALRPDTRLAVLSHGSNVLGSVQDISAIGKILHDHEVFFVADGAQTCGLVEIDLGHLPLDAFVFTGHKYLFGFPGTGGFYIRDPARVASTRQGGTGTDSRYPFQPQDMPEKFETGTHNYPGLVSLAAGIAFLTGTGQDAITRSIRKQMEIFLQEFSGTGAIHVYNPKPDLPVISFNIRDLENDDAGFILRRMYGIVTRTGLHCAPLVHGRIDGSQGSVRISPSVLTPEEMCRSAAASVREVAESAQ
jgi:selenocysteine lyase/cysteine desulfurase